MSDGLTLKLGLSAYLARNLNEFEGLVKPHLSHLSQIEMSHSGVC